jgi:hypothetical protein
MLSLVSLGQSILFERRSKSELRNRCTKRLLDLALKTSHNWQHREDRRPAKEICYGQDLHRYKLYRSEQHAIWQKTAYAVRWHLRSDRPEHHPKR